MKLYIDINEVRNDERISELMETLITTLESQRATNALVERIVQVANSHIWGMLIQLQQEEENQEVSQEESSNDNEGYPKTPTVRMNGNGI